MRELMHKNTGMIRRLVTAGLVAVLSSGPLAAAGRAESAATARPAPAESPVGNPPGGRIVFAGLDGNVYTVDPASGETVAVTTDAEAGRKEYLLAAWHPDGKTLAFVELNSLDGATAGSRVIVTPATPRPGASRTVHEAAGTAPTYLSWSPDGGRLGYLESPRGDTSSLELYTVLAVKGVSERVSAGRPLYWDWSADGMRIVAHAGAVADKTGTTSLTTHEWSGLTESGASIGTPTSRFQSPDVAASGRAFVMAGYPNAEALEQRDAHILLVSTTGEVVRELVGVGGAAAFQLSPAEDRLAFIDGNAAASGGIVGSLGIMVLDDPSEGEPRLVALTEADDVVAFFWSPDGSSLVYFRPQMSGGGRGRFLTLEASLMDARTGASRSVAVFQPTPLLMSRLVPFFDQYQRSATIWAPDGSAFTVNAMVSGRPAVIVVSTAEGAKPSVVGYGNLPFWSPR